MTNDLYFSDVRNQLDVVTLFRNDNFVVSKIEGIRWGQKEASLSSNAFTDGDTIQNIKGMPREVNIELKPLNSTGDFSEVYDYFSQYLGRTVYLYWKGRKTKDGTFNMWLEGTMITCEMPMFENDVRVTFTIHCENPYWMGGIETLNVSAGQSGKLKGTAPPYNPYVEVTNGLIPTGSGNWLHIGGWFFNATSTDLTGKVIASCTKTSKILTVGGASHLETIASAFSPSGLVNPSHNISCTSSKNGTYAGYTFSITYNPQWY